MSPAASSSGPLLRESTAVEQARFAHVNVTLLANRAQEDLEAICREFGLTQAQYFVLWELCLTEDPQAGQPIGAISDGLLTRSSDVTRLVDRLEQGGLAERLPNPADRRGVLVRATAKGREVFADTTARVQAFHRRQWSNLDPGELDELNRLLTKALWGDPESSS